MQILFQGGKPAGVLPKAGHYTEAGPVRGGAGVTVASIQYSPLAVGIGQRAVPAGIGHGAYKAYHDGPDVYPRFDLTCMSDCRTNTIPAFNGILEESDEEVAVCRLWLDL
ncbi:hypothetical protein RE428_45340 [Marinobacter nanhaiticus D15-8W]|nr:hypothetical protein RE428_45340 [Marinobacter nanhaiticus D15-8W]